MNEPYVSIELVNYLKATFPNSLPMRDDITVEEVRRLQGIQHVISVLEQLHQVQQQPKE